MNKKDIYDKEFGLRNSINICTKSSLPSDILITQDARELIYYLSVGFAQKITQEADKKVDEIMKATKSKGSSFLNLNHFAHALKSMGFEEYLSQMCNIEDQSILRKMDFEELGKALGKTFPAKKKRTKRKLTFEEEEALKKEQAKVFSEARKELGHPDYVEQTKATSEKPILPTATIPKPLPQTGLPSPKSTTNISVTEEGNSSPTDPFLIKAAKEALSQDSHKSEDTKH
ncbi:unnamed protein product [Moneuplotes crassus]|uniref:Uncharacterized protein n=1 Tax=Euplotes crassus TaxID=5936 RepID=A0AAD1XTU7_EUPCR|nr:unnamed protein product [Moneuplotes crassus]